MHLPNIPLEEHKIMLPLLVSAISIIEVVVLYEFHLLLFLVLTKRSLLQKKIHSRNVFYFKYFYSSCHIYNFLTKTNSLNETRSIPSCT